MSPAVDFRAERLNRGKSIEAFAADIGVSPDVIRHLEANGNRPRPANALLVAAYFGLTVTTLWPDEPAAGDLSSDGTGDEA